MIKKYGMILLLVLFASNVQAASQPFQLALSAVFLGEQQDMVMRWQKYLEAHLHRPVAFVQRRSYRELIELFEHDRLDGGWVCSSPYVRHKSLQRLLAVPVWQGEPLYQSYLIVPKRDISTRSMADLRGKIFAYSDPDSNSGYYVPQSDILHLGADPKTFFSKTLFTYSHRKSVEAVADGLVDGARVDGYIYDQLKKFYPEMIEKTRLVDKSDKYGFPPMVTRANLPEADFKLLRDTLLNMHNDAEGRALLAAMGLDKFITGDDHLFDGVAALIKYVEQAGVKRVQ